LDSAKIEYADQFVHQLIAEAERCRASDVHFQPREDGVEIKWRIDGVLLRVGLFARGEQSNAVTKLKVLAGLLTYRNDIPQEGRIRDFSTTEMRLATYPTVFGERAVVRLFAAPGNLKHLSDLGLPKEVSESIATDLAATSGAVVICGPAGSGKTTTAYACLRALGERAVMTIEDPVESLVDGAVQSQTDIKSGFDLASGIRAMMRQDPEVILVGEVRDPETAAGAFSAALTGHLMLTTIHAGAAAEAAFRLIDMGVESHTLRATLLGVVGQRLVRRLCKCARPATDVESMGVAGSKMPVGCDACQQTGYWGRVVLAEYLDAQDAKIRAGIQTARTSQEIQQMAVDAGMVTLHARAMEAVRNGTTSPSETAH
jgi:general secretion pathway protein E